MTKEELFDTWAPVTAAWSPWAKPVLFAQPLAAESLAAAAPQPAPPADDRWLLPASGQRAVVVDLVGVESVRVGLALAERGHRPVPLFNTCPDPAAIIDVRPLVQALAAGGDVLRRTAPAPDAPPAFLLDAARMKPATPPAPGKFDNRWVVFPQDFPSATFLRTRGITEVVLIHDGGRPQEDLAHVLRRWQEAGLTILSQTPREDRAQPITVEKPSWFRRTWYRVIAMSGLRRNNAGGFGAAIPVAAAGGGYG